MIISGFAGIGKSTLDKEVAEVLDLESTNYKFLYDPSYDNLSDEEKKGLKGREMNPEWPSNYIDAIIEEENHFDFVLIAMNPEIREGLIERDVEFALAYPSLESKEVVLQGMRSRGNNENFVNLLSTNYEKWIGDLENQPQRKIRLQNGEFLGDALRREGWL